MSSSPQKTSEVYLYPEYRQLAYKHLTVCRILHECYRPTEWNVKTDLRVCRELYYLLGYTLEAIAVYCVYKKGGWERGRNIQEWEPTFTDKTKICYRFRGNPSANNIGVLQFAGHRILPIIRRELLDRPEFRGIPYLDSECRVEAEVVELISHWRPSIRYDKGLPPIEPTHEVLGRMIEVVGGMLEAMDRV